MITDWDDAYANAPHIPDGASYPDRWREAAGAFRAGLPPERLRESLPYGRAGREKVDLFLPEGPAQGVAIFVHGGYWRAFDRDLWSHLAAGPLARGWVVAMPGYTLAPDARIAAITRAVTEAVIQIAAAAQGPIVLAGHSAGGHLVARQACADAALPERVASRIDRIVSISGLHDLRPLLRLPLNADLRLDAEEAAAESPALLMPRPGVRVHAWAGGAERAEFIRQSRLLADVWTGLGAATEFYAEPDRHHFNVVDGLADPDHALTLALTA